MRISDWSSDVCSSDLEQVGALPFPSEPVFPGGDAGFRVDFPVLGRDAPFIPGGEGFRAEAGEDLRFGLAFVGAVVDLVEPGERAVERVAGGGGDGGGGLAGAEKRAAVPDRKGVV